jgi:hypothetical protein
LAKVNVSAEDIAELKSKIDAWEETTPLFLEKKSEKKIQKQNCDAGLSVMLNFMNKCLDVSVQSLQKTDAEFVSLYENTRTAGKERIRTRLLSVTVKSAEGNGLLINAIVTIIGTKIKVKTDNYGVAVLKPGNQKEMNVSVSKPGFKTAVQRVDFIKAKSKVSLEFVLEAEKGTQPS